MAGLLAALLFVLAAPDAATPAGALGAWMANGARLELKDEGGKVVGRLSAEGGGAGRADAEPSRRPRRASAWLRPARRAQGGNAGGRGGEAPRAGRLRAERRPLRAGPQAVPGFGREGPDPRGSLQRRRRDL